MDSGFRSEVKVTGLVPASIPYAVKVFLEAFEVSDPERAEHAEDFWRLLHGIGAAGFLGAELGGMMVGCGALVGYEQSAWIAFMAVLPEFRGRGIGDSIMRALMARAEERGYGTLMLDATNWGRPLYVQHGFQPLYRAKTFEILIGDTSGAREEPSILIDEDIPGWCLAMDREAFGDDRSLLLRQLLKEGGQLVVEENRGFGILWKRKIGPVIADSPAVAKNIIRYAQVLGAKRIYVPLHGELPPDFLADLDEVTPQASIRCCERMSLGNRLEADNRLVYASFSAATG